MQRVFILNYFRIEDLKKKILFSSILFGGMLLMGIILSCFAGRSRMVSVFLQQDEQIKKVALSFDDGPNPEYTELLLDGLKERGVKASFFVLGSEVEQYPQIVRRASEEGHLIGVHAYKHVNLRQLSDEKALEQVRRTNEAIYQATGQYASYIRPPYGCWKENLDGEVQMVEVLWDIDPRDWATTSSDLVVQRVLREVEENSIILLHDASASSVRSAFRIIDTLQKEGYMFVTVEDLLLE